MLYRELKLNRKNGEMEVIRFSVEEPEYVPADENHEGSWRCMWILDVIHSEPSYIHGVDAVDCIMNVLAFMNKLCINLESKGIIVWWLDESDKGGFSVK